MPSSIIIHSDNLRGLSPAQVTELREKHGKNLIQVKSSRRLFHVVWDIVKEPMFLLLVIASLLYFIVGDISEGVMMFVAMLLVAAISLYQELKSTHAINALKQYAEPKVSVIRDGKECIVDSIDLLPGDVVKLEEGMNVPADAIVLQANDLSVNESIITGESIPSDKHELRNNLLFQGTTVNSGKCMAKVTATGSSTILGKLGIAVGVYQTTSTLLQRQINGFVKWLAVFGLAGFFFIFILNYINGQPFASSLLFALTLAMSAIPEEIPVAFSSFMALGAYKMSRLGVISRQPSVVENLGAVSVICLDKTGTITQNKMKVEAIYSHSKNLLTDLRADADLEDDTVLFYAMLASEQAPFDAMEKAILEAYHSQAINPIHTSPHNLIHEYPLEGHPPMMTHVYAYNGEKIVAAKGAVERIVGVSDILPEDATKIHQQANSLASKGYRVIAVASATHDEKAFPVNQDDFTFTFQGLVALYDPPKENIPLILHKLLAAHIQVKMLSGDSPETAMNIAQQVGMLNYEKCLTGDQVMKMETAELKESVKGTNVFARMFPESKGRVIEAIQLNNEIVAMTGDGVNDGPALMKADIGIAMGKHGTEIAKQASDLILTEDDLSPMVEAISEGRKIFNNLKKAIRYIVSIHIPIILTASIPVILAWQYPNIFTPIHIIFLELIMGPTCSVFFENEPTEKDLMSQHPRATSDGLFTHSEWLMSIIQGLVISIGTLGLYFYYMTNGAELHETRTIVFTTLILSNLFLTFANRSFTNNFWQTVKYKNKLAPILVVLTIIFLGALHFIPFVQNLFQLTTVSEKDFLVCIIVSFLSVVWFELYKIIKVQGMHK